MNKYIIVVERWLKDPTQISQEDLDKNKKEAFVEMETGTSNYSLRCFAFWAAEAAADALYCPIAKASVRRRVSTYYRYAIT